MKKILIKLMYCLEHIDDLECKFWLLVLGEFLLMVLGLINVIFSIMQLF